MFMKKIHIFCFIIATLIATSCSTKPNGMIEKAIKDYVLNEETIHVLAIPVGENIQVPNEPSAQHVHQIPTSGRVIYNENVWLTNRIFYRTVTACLGCDSCMTAFANAGLIDYKRKADGIADVYLTPNGEKYRIENFLPDFNIDDREGVEFVVIAYSNPENIRTISNYCENYHYCEADVNVLTTPFLDCMAYDASKENQEKLSKKHYWKIKIHTKEEYEKLKENYPDSDPYFIEHLNSKESIFYRGNDAAYDLDKYTKEEALSHFLGLSDTMAIVTEYYKDWDGLYISNYGKFKNVEDIPQSAKDALLQVEGRKYYFLVGSRKLGKILSDKKMPKWQNPEDAGEHGQLKWNLNELYYTVDADYTEFAATVHECPEKLTYYGKIPYIVFDNTLYFIPDAERGLWAYDIADLEAVNYNESLYDWQGKVMRPLYTLYSIPFRAVGL